MPGSARRTSPCRSMHGMAACGRASPSPVLRCSPLPQVETAVAPDPQSASLKVSANAVARGSLLGATRVRRRHGVFSRLPAGCAGLPLGQGAACSCPALFLLGDSSEMPLSRVMQTRTTLVEEEGGEVTVQRDASSAVQRDGCPACSCSTLGVSPIVHCCWHAHGMRRQACAPMHALCQPFLKPGKRLGRPYGGCRPTAAAGGAGNPAGLPACLV